VRFNGHAPNLIVPQGERARSGDHTQRPGESARVNVALQHTLAEVLDLE
jgi:hypothetical protein